MFKSPYLLAILAISLLAATSANACETYLDIPEAQFKEISTQVSEAGELDLDAILQYSRLVCSNQSMLRDYARRLGLKSRNPSIRSHALLASLMEKETVVLKTYKVKGLDKLQKEFIKKTPTISYSVGYIDQEKACISLVSEKECRPNHAISVEGNSVTLHNSYDLATLELNDTNELIGEFNNSRAKRIPVKLMLQ